MLSEARVRALFREYLPDGIDILTLDAKTYIDQTKNHPYIQLQMQMGVYTEQNITEDFLSPARAHTELRLQVICMEIFNQILEGIPDNIAENYVRHVAAHEAHHFHEAHEPVSATDHSEAELLCAQRIVAAHPELNDAVAYVEVNSPVYRRVYSRLGQIRKNLTTKGSAR